MRMWHFQGKANSCLRLPLLKRDVGDGCKLGCEFDFYVVCGHFVKNELTYPGKAA